MRTYIKAVKIINSASQWHNQSVDILIDDGKIAEINPSGNIEADHVIQSEQLFASPSWLDMRVFSGEPGEEYREDFESLANVLEAGGFGAALLMPNTSPVIQNKSDIKTVMSCNSKQVSQFLPAATVTTNCDGENLNEILDVHHAGAVAFTDGSQPLWNSDIVVKTLQYLQKFDGLLMTIPQDYKLALHGQMSEGIVSTGLGLKGIPHLAEEITIQRDLELLKYAGGRLHFSCISSRNSVQMIREAKAAGLKVTCDVSIHHLVLDDENLESFDTNYKVLPPLRTKSDIEALIQGVNDGTIDVIVSAHQPYDQDHKKMEFDLADFGIMGAQIVYPLYEEFLSSKIELETFIKCIESNPKRILNQPQATIEKGEDADITIFTSIENWKFDAESNQSKSDNSPFMNHQFSAKVLGVIKNKQQYLDLKFTDS